MTTRRVTAEELIGLLEAGMAEAVREGRGGAMAVASDGDNTLWRGDVGDALFVYAYSHRLLRDEARVGLVAEAAAYDIDVGGDANDIARVLFEAQRAGAYPDARAYAMMAWAFAGHEERALEALCETVLDEFDFEPARRSEMEPVLGWCRSLDVPFWLVSASPLWMVRVAARRLGLSGERVVAMTPRAEGGVVQPALASAPTYAEGKLARLRERTDAALLAAFGDSDFDAALLAAAAIPVAVHPTAGLLRHLEALEVAVVLGGA